MSPRSLFAFCMAVLAGAAFAATPDELVPVQSRYLDKVYLRPNADLASYRRVLIDSVQVEIRNDWLTHMNAYNRDVSRWVGPEVGLRIARETASSLQGIAGILRARTVNALPIGNRRYSRLQICATSPPCRPLQFASPLNHGIIPPWRVKTFTRDAGQATLLLEARDAMSGTLLGRVEHRGIAREMGGQLTFTNDVTNRFWFDALFRRWAESCVAEFEAGKY